APAVPAALTATPVGSTLSPVSLVATQPLTTRQEPEATPTNQPPRTTLPSQPLQVSEPPTALVTAMAELTVTESVLTATEPPAAAPAPTFTSIPTREWTALV